MYERIDECPVCGHTGFGNYLVCRDYTASWENFALVKCKNCTHIFTNPRPDAHSLDKYYQSDRYTPHNSRSMNFTSVLFNLARLYTIRWKYHIVKPYLKHSSLMDFGCGTGEFLKYVSNRVRNTVGVEPSKRAKENMLRGIEVLSGIPDSHTGKFDVITAWHALEHIPDIKSQLRKLRSLIHEKGRIIAAMPNSNSYDAAYYKEFWAAYDVPRHLHHFNKSSIEKLCTKTKLKIDAILPMPLDAYYMAMLSERYKEGKINVWKTIKTGYLSNHKARKNNHSSLIYILRK